MKLKSLNRYIGFLIFLILFSPLHAEEEIDIWNKEKKENSQSDQVQDKDSNIINKPTIFNSIKKKK